MIILAIDPGMTTGYAVIDELGNLLESGNLLPEDLDNSILTYKKYQDPTTCEVVIEYTPIPTQSRMNRRLKEVTGKIGSMFPNAVYVTPGVWKSAPIAKRFPFPFPHGTPHQKDAFRMGIHHMMFRRIK